MELFAGTKNLSGRRRVGIKQVLSKRHEGFCLCSDDFSCDKFLETSTLADVNQTYSFGAVLGKGSFGTVRKCVNIVTGSSFACKTLSKSSVRSPLDLQDLKAEVWALQSLRFHPSVVKLHEVFEDETDVHLIMEWCKGGDLFSRVQEQGVLSEAEAAGITLKLASILVQAHARGIMHRDIKPENILLTSKSSSTDIRLADFGSSAAFYPGQKLTQLVGSPLYICPSVLEHQYGPEADLWSLGVVLYILLFGVPPFWGRTNAEIFTSILKDPLCVNGRGMGRVSGEAKDLIQKLLNRNTREVISAREVMVHPWILKYTSTLSRSDCHESTPQNPRKFYRLSLDVGTQHQRFPNWRMSDSELEVHRNSQTSTQQNNDSQRRNLRNVLDRSPTPYSPLSPILRDYLHEGN